MAKNSITDYDNISGNNTDVQSVDISEGCSPSGINNAIREVMADLADVNDGTVALTSPQAANMTVTGTVTTDTIAENTSAAGVTIDGVLLKDGGIDVNGNELILDADGDTSITADTDDQIDFKTGGSDRMTIDSSGNVGIGTTSPSEVLDLSAASNPRLRFEDDGDFEYTIGIKDNNAFTISSGGSDDERMRIDSSGRLLVGTTDTALYNNTSGQGLIFDATGGSTQMLRDGGACLLVNRASSDGSIVVFYQNGSAEGSISVSGTTVSFNGGHLARWSRLADNNKDTSIVKGTVMTNLDEMVEWGDEDNEQLNKMAVSSVEGDVNVSGVFVNWDEDDDWNDMNIAMTGDMVIRIAQGTTVQRGDLLMSAGDGTAKPQGDDIVRSKTIAKVTSTSVSQTYDDGSYLVPCVLMAC